jgi:hypothetical protein
MIAVPERNLIFLEVRHGETFQVEFSALDYHSNQFIWKDWKMKESWWVSLTAANRDTLLLHTFVNRGNPDHKNLIACDIFSKTIRWEVEEFSFYDWDEAVIKGYRTKEDIVPAVINSKSGEVTEEKWEASNPPVVNNTTIKPMQYVEGALHFETVQKFIELRIQKPISAGVEYLEYGNWIIVSVYIRESEGLANYLLVMTQEGELVLKEKLGEKLEGLGVDTFFILSGCLFFVKNRLELVAYTFYD